MTSNTTDSLSDVQLLAVGCASHVLSQMPPNATEDEKIAKLWHTYNEACIKIQHYAQ